MVNRVYNDNNVVIESNMTFLPFRIVGLCGGQHHTGQYWGKEHLDHEIGLKLGV